MNGKMNSRTAEICALAGAMLVGSVLTALACDACAKKDGTCGTSYSNGPSGNPPCVEVTCSTDNMTCSGVTTDYYCTNQTYTATCSKQTGTVWKSVDENGMPVEDCVNWQDAGTVDAACSKIASEVTGCD